GYHVKVKRDSRTTVQGRSDASDDHKVNAMVVKLAQDFEKVARHCLPCSRARPARIHRLEPSRHADVHLTSNTISEGLVRYNVGNQAGGEKWHEWQESGCSLRRLCWRSS